MKENIAKRYVDALVQTSTPAELQGYQTVFQALAQSLKDEKSHELFFSPYVKDEDRVAILLDAVKPAKSEKINNLMKLLVEKRRMNIIDALADSLRLIIAQQTKNYAGIVSSNTAVKKETVKNFETGIGSKIEATLSLEAVKSDYNGVKIEVDDLGLDVSFSKSHVRQHMIQHILKSI